MPEQAATATTAIPAPSHGPHTQEELAVSIRSAAGRFVRRLRAERPAHGLTMTQISALFSVAKGDGTMTPRQLAQVERVQPPAATRTVAALEERGLVRRAPHPTDGRQVVLSMTPAGDALLLADRRAREAWLAARLAELDEADQQTLRAAAALLDRLASA
jgi:DNA-binding MarR family transcriptional regulator